MTGVLRPALDRLRFWRDETWEDAARSLEGVVLAAAGRTGYQGSMGHTVSGRQRLTSVGVRHLDGDRELEIQTGHVIGWPQELIDWRLTRSALHRSIDLERLSFPVAARVDRWTADVSVDGTARAFVFVGNDDSWAAHAVLGDREVLLEGSRWSPRELNLSTVRADTVRPPDRPTC